MRAIGLMLAVIGCSDQKITSYTAPPIVSIQYPIAGTELDEGVPQAMRGLVVDDIYADNLAALTAAWSVDGEPICDGAVVDAGGYTDCTWTPSAPGEVSISLLVSNPDGEATSDTAEVTIVANNPPEVEILSPEAAGVYYTDHLTLFEAQVFDTEDEADLLTVVFESSVDGLLDIDETPTSSGSVTGSQLLSAGEHQITATVTDTTGRTGEDTIIISIAGPNTVPDCEILSPVMSAIFEEGETILFEGSATDPDIPETWLSASWASDKDGTLANASPDSAGNLFFATSSLSTNTHTITLSVTDEVDTVCSDVVVIKVGSGPSVSITAPTSGTVFNEDQTVTISVSASDNEDAPDELSLSWSSSLDGVFSTQPADSSGSASVLTGNLSNGTHTLSVTATDTDGLTATAQTVVVINDLPTAPTVAITPDPATSADDLVVAVTVPSTDEEGDAITYSYAWTVDGSATSYTTTTVPDSATARGEKWAVTVTPSDGHGSGSAGTDSITVGNAAPVLAAVTLSPDPATEADTLTCTPGSVTDADGDPVTYSYAWTVNGGGSSKTTATLTGSSFSRGDTVSCTVTPSDGYDAGTAVTSNTVTIDNEPPVLASVSLTPTTSYEASTLTCTPGSVTDADGDSVTYSYSWTVATVTLSVTTSTLTGTWFDRDEAVTCTVTPSDGYDAGTAVTSNTVTIKNTAPVVASASLSPTTAYETSTLSCAAGTISDDDGDSTTTSYAWTVNGGSISPTTATLTGTWFDRDDAVACIVSASDGTDTGAGATSNTVTISNSRPSATSVAITPASAYTLDDLTATVSGWSDKDPGDSEGYTWQWYLDGSPISGATSSTLDYTEFVKDDRITVAATPFDGTDSGTAVTSSTRTILNTPPTAPVVLVVPTDAEPEDDLECTITTESEDDDGDTVSYSYAWTVDGSTTSITTDTVDASYTADSESWKCTVTPYDGDDYGSAGSDAQTVVDQTAPDAPTVDAIDELRNTTSVSLSGTAEPGADITIYADCLSAGLKTFTTTADSTGSWSKTISISRGDDCEYTVYATDDAGNVSDPSNSVATESCDPYDSYEDSSTYGDVCSDAVDEWTTLGDASPTSFTLEGNIIESTDADWYVVHTSQSVLTSGTNLFHFEVTMTAGSSDYAFTVYKGSCSSADVQCGTTGHTEYEMYAEDQADGSHSAPSDTRLCSSSSSSRNHCEDLSDDYYIQVFRTSSGYDCAYYELEISNGIW
jgi:hypothetical protein